MQELQQILNRIAVALEALALKCGALSPQTPLSVSSLNLNSSSEEFKSEEKNFGKESEKTLLTLKPKRKSPELPDDAWLSSLSSDPAYAGLDVPMHVARCKNWCEMNGKLFSRRRIVAWLNRQEKPLQVGNLALKPTVDVIPPKPPANDPIARGLWARQYGHLFQKSSQ